MCTWFTSLWIPTCTRSLSRLRHSRMTILSISFSRLCDVEQGYNASECLFVEQGFNCLISGREDEDYLKWRWKPKNCEIPRVTVRHVLEALQNKRVVFVGNSTL